MSSLWYRQTINFSLQVFTGLGELSVGLWSNTQEPAEWSLSMDLLTSNPVLFSKPVPSTLLVLFFYFCAPWSLVWFFTYGIAVRCECVPVKSIQSCLTLCGPMDYSPPGPSVHGISQTRILEWVAICFSRRSSHPGIEPASHVRCIGGRFFTITVTW